MQPSQSQRWFELSILAVVALVAFQFSDFPLQGQDKAVDVPLAQFISVTSPIDDAVFARVSNAALNLQNRAVQENRRAILVLEIDSGTSPPHQVLGLAKALVSSKLSRVKTVAWIPEDVSGHNVILALACNEIVMHPDSRLGDIGRGEALDRDEQQAVLSLVENRHNVKLTPALVLGMMDPGRNVYKVKLGNAAGDAAATESRIVTPEELKELRENQTPILDVATIKEAGFAGAFSGKQARSLDVLAVQTADSRGEVAQLYGLRSEALREDPTLGKDVVVRLIRVNEVITPLLESFLDRQISRAQAEGANLLIFEIKSPGGLLVSSINLAQRIASLDPKAVRTVAYIPEMALSGAAIIALGCDEIYMHTGATIGDAIPIEMHEGNQFAKVPEKILSTMMPVLKDLAQKKNRPPALAMAMANPNLKVFQVTHKEDGRISFMTEDEIHQSDGQWVQGRPLAETEGGLALTVNGERAHELHLAEPVVRDLGDLQQRLGIPNAALIPLQQTWVDKLIFVLNTPFAKFMLFVIGIACIYLELHFMTGLLGIIAALSFSLFFWSQMLGGTAGWLEVTLFLLGFVFLALEFFVIPGFGVFGVSGGLLVIASLVLAAQTIQPLEPSQNMEKMAETVGMLSLSVVTVVAMGVLLSRYLPHMPVFNQMILNPPTYGDSSRPDEPRLRPELTGDSRWGTNPITSLVGERGTAISVLRPAGKAKIADQFLDVVSEGAFIPANAKVEVVQVNGNHITVREV